MANLRDKNDIAFAGQTDGQFVRYSSGVGKWVNATVSQPAATAPEGMLLFDSFAGANDSAKITSLNNWAMARGTSTCPVILFAPRTYSFNTPIKLFSGLKLRGSAGVPARTFGRPSTILNWTGGSGTSMLIFPPEGQTNQSYPASGAPRDITMSGFQFMGPNNTHFMPKNTAFNAAYVLWYVQFYNCGWKNFETVWWGWGTGVSISGPSFIENIVDTSIQVGGSENLIFGLDHQSVITNTLSGWASSGKPFLRSNMDKSVIGNVLMESRGNSYGIAITGGTNHRLLGVSIIGQTGNPMQGSAVKISGSNGLTMENCVVHGAMNSPASATGGESVNRGYVHISGGTNIVVQGNQFAIGASAAPAHTAAIYASLSTNNSVKVGMNGYEGFREPTYLWQSATSKIIKVTADTTSTVHTGSSAPAP